MTVHSLAHTIEETNGLSAEIQPARGTLVRAGDPEAYAGLVAEHQTALIRYLRRMTRCPERAQDLAQEAFVRLYTSRDRYHERGHVAAYLFRIATNLLRSEERRKARWRLLEPKYRAGIDERGSETADHRSQQSESKTQVRRAIAQLPTRFRAPLILREIEGWSYAEIATMLGCREGTAKSRVNRAKAKLKDQLKSYWASQES